MTSPTPSSDLTTAPIRVVLADDHPVIREAFGAILERDERFELLARVRDGAELVSHSAVHHADVVVTDYSMGPLNGIEATRRLVGKTPGIKVLMVSAFSEHHLVTEALRAGATGYMLKSSPLQDLTAAIAHCAAGHTVIDGMLQYSQTRARQLRLSARQLEILQLLATGLSRTDIAARLHLSPNTVKTHITHAYQVLGASRVQEAVRKATDMGLIDTHATLSR